ncbi:MAG: SGNH/GDSL hydrolase family protein [Planctomycetes bacterium]|nr:SGNH/GDSL hydrolase family protein [Planctomycetota bacterium]
MTAPRRRRIRRRVLAVAVGCVVALVAGEVAVRILGLPDTSRLFLSAQDFSPDEFRSDPELFWLLSPRHPEANGLGLRGPWFAEPKRAGEYRILAVGDSCTFGAGVAWEETWGVRLERAMQAVHPDKAVRTGLAALPGYSTFQDERLLERILPAVAPDLVVFYCGAWNDHVPAAGASDATLAARLSVSRLFVLVHALFQPGLAPVRAAFERGEAPDGRRVPVDEFERRLGAMAARCRAMGATVAFIVPSQPPDTQRRFPGLGDYRSAVQHAAERAGVVLVDLAAVCARLDPDGAPPLPGHSTACFMDWVHPTRTVYAALAAELCARVDGGTAAPEPANLPLLDLRDGAVVVAAGADAAAPLRVWIGERPVRASRVDGELRATVPPRLPPGDHVLQVVDGSGARSLGIVRVAARPLDAARGLGEGAARTIVLSGEAQPGDLVVAFVTTERLRTPLATPCGPLLVDVPGLGAPRAGVVRFDLVAAGRPHTIAGPDGRWRIDVTIPRDPSAPRRDLHAQAIVLDQATLQGALTASATIPDGP